MVFSGNKLYQPDSFCISLPAHQGELKHGRSVRGLEEFGKMQNTSSLFPHMIIQVCMYR